MEKAITIRGLEDTKRALDIANIKFHALKVEALKKFGQKVRQIARGALSASDGIDTGALYASIYEKLLVDSIIETIELISAGDKDIFRGKGRFKFSSKSGKIVSEMATERYAHVIENQKKFMQTAFDWADANIERTIRSLLNASLRGM